MTRFVVGDDRSQSTLFRIPTPDTALPECGRM